MGDGTGWLVIPRALFTCWEKSVSKSGILTRSPSYVGNVGATYCTVSKGGTIWLKALHVYDNSEASFQSTHMPDTSMTLKTCWALEEGLPMETLRALSML